MGDVGSMWPVTEGLTCQAQKPRLCSTGNVEPLNCLSRAAVHMSVCVWGTLIGHGRAEKEKDWIRKTRFGIQVIAEASSHTEHSQ